MSGFAVMVNIKFPVSKCSLDIAEEREEGKEGKIEERSASKGAVRKVYHSTTNKTLRGLESMLASSESFYEEILPF